MIAQQSNINSLCLLLPLLLLFFVAVVVLFLIAEGFVKKRTIMFIDRKIKSQNITPLAAWVGLERKSPCFKIQAGFAER